MLFLMLITVGSFAATYYSTGSVAVNTLTNWKTARDGTGTSPANFTTASDVFVIQNGHSMTTSATWAVSGTGAKIQIENGGILTATFLVSGTSFQVDNGGTYRHNHSGLTLPTATWSTGSNCEYIYAGTGGSLLGLGQSFSNLTINAGLTGSLQCSSTLTTVNGNLTISNTGTGEFRLATSGTYTLNIGGNLNLNGGILNTNSSSATVAININVAGNMNINGGVLATASTATPARSINITGSLNITNANSSIAANGGAGTNWTVGNGMTISAGTFSLGSSSSHVTNLSVTGNISLSGKGALSNTSSGSDTVTCTGNFTMIDSALYQMQNSSTTTKGYVLNVGGNFSATSGCTVTGGSNSSGGTVNFTGGTASVTYTNAGTLTASKPIQWVVAAGKTVLLNNDLVTTNGSSVNGGVTVNGTLDCSTNKVSGSGNFALGASGKLIIGDAVGITALGTATGSVQTTLSRTFPTTANYEYKGSVAQVTGTGLPARVNNLTINNSAGVSLTAIDSVAGTLTLTSGKLSLGNFNLTMVGTGSSISGPAAFGSTSTNYIVTNGTGSLVISSIGTSNRTGAILFPVGASASLYNPVTVTNTGTSDNFSVRAVSGVPTGLTSAYSVNNGWVVSEATSGGSTATLGFQWAAAQENASFSRTNCSVVGTNGTSIVTTPSYATSSGSGPYTRSLSSITSFNSVYGVNTPIPVTLPTLNGTTVTNVRIDSARVTSSVTYDGNSTISERGFVYGNNIDPTVDDIKVPDAANTTGSMTALLEFLTPNTTYYVRSFATNELGTAYGTNQTFTTLDYPALTTTAASSVTSSAASSGGEITSDGGAAITQRGIVYSTSSGPTTADTKIINGSTGTGAYSSSISGLSQATTYYVRAYAINIAGTFYGQEETFTTLANAPTVTTTAMSSITGISASSGGNVTNDEEMQLLKEVLFTVHLLIQQLQILK